MENVILRDLGLSDYKETWDFQEQLLTEMVNRKLSARSLSELDKSKLTYNHNLILCEHPPTITLGRSGDKSNLLLSQEQLTVRGVKFYKINRGGDITYHGPGQLVGYPILDLDRFFTDVHRYVRSLEEAIILTLADFGIDAFRVDDLTGVWLHSNHGGGLSKICAIGVHLRRWVTLHGFAFNINTNLSHFEMIVPCGISTIDKSVTSMEKEMGKRIDMEVVKGKLLGHLSDIFEFQLT